MLSEFTASVVDFAARLLAGGLFELVVFVILVILAIVVVIVAIWLAWKLLVLLAKGSVWLARTSFALARERSAARRERRLGTLVRVATGWPSRSRIPLRSAPRAGETNGGRGRARHRRGSERGQLQRSVHGPGNRRAGARDLQHRGAGTGSF